MDAKKLIEEVILDLGNNKNLTEVSSKIQIIVRLLGDDKLKAWYNCEFVKGYQDEELPDYRVATAAEIKADYFVPHGFGLLSVSGQSVPVANLGMEKYKKIMSISFKDTISSIIEYAKHPEQIAMSLTPYELIQVQKVLGDAQIQRAHKVIPPAVFKTIIDNVQSRIIDLFMDLDERVFNGQLDIESASAKEEIHQVITNNFTAGVIQTGAGKIDITNSTVAASIEGSITDEVKARLLNLADEIEKVAKEADEEFDEVAENMVAIKAELASANPQPRTLKNTFKAIAWGASVACKATIEELVEKAIDLIS